ncbi:MAG: cyanophycinase [Candidatus Hydrothermales bacterium]
MKKLILTGGNVKKNSLIFKRIAGEYKGGKVLILPYASEDPLKTYFYYQEVFKKYSIDNILSFLYPNSRDRIDIKTLEKNINESEIIFFTGGNQLKLTTLFGGTDFIDFLKNIKKDVTIIGTSAGAAFLGDIMIYDGPAKKGIYKGGVELTKGLGLIENVVVDTHFTERGRLLRLIQVVITNPSLLGIGISENTAIFVEKNRFEVVGEKVVVVVNGMEIKRTNIPDKRPGEPFGAENVKVDILSPGGIYDLSKKEVVVL